MIQPQTTELCTCHPDDNPPIPCPKKYAYTECATTLKVQEIKTFTVRQYLEAISKLPSEYLEQEWLEIKRVIIDNEIWIAHPDLKVIIYRDNKWVQLEFNNEK